MCRGAECEGWPLKRHLMSRGVNLYARWLLWLSPKDCSGGYRCYRTATLAKLDFDRIRSRGYSFQEEILWLLRRAGARFGETPIIFADREKGSSKINSREAVAALRIILRLGVQNLVGHSCSPRAFSSRRGGRPFRIDATFCRGPARDKSGSFPLRRLARGPSCSRSCCRPRRRWAKRSRRSTAPNP